MSNKMDDKSPIDSLKVIIKDTVFQSQECCEIIKLAFQSDEGLELILNIEEKLNLDYY